MPDNALALIKEKIAQTEDKLAKLRLTEQELSKLTDRAASGVRRGRPRRIAPIKAETDHVGSLASRLRDFLQTNSPTPASAIAEALGVETRPISFALQALKRKGEAKSVGGEWSIKRRSRKA